MTATYYGFNPPFIGGPQNIMSRQEDDRIIKNDILQLLLTVPGERVMRPDFGINLRNFVFEQMVDRDLNQLQQEIYRGLAEFEPRVNVEDVILQRKDDQNQLLIRVIVNLKKDPRRQLTIDQLLNLTSQA